MSNIPEHVFIGHFSGSKTLDSYHTDRDIDVTDGGHKVIEKASTPSKQTTEPTPADC